MDNTSSNNVETQKRTGKVFFFVHLFIVLSVAIMWLSFLYNSMFIFGAIIAIPILIAALVSLYFTLDKRQWGWKVIISLHGVNYLLYIFALISSEPSAFSMERHYESHKKQMMDLVEYTHKAVDGTGAFLLECDWLLHLDENMPSSAVMEELGLTQMELDTIVMLLKKTGCKGIILSNSARVPEILYQREGMGAFYYRLRMPDSPLEDWVNVCSDAGYTSTTYTDSVLFEYGSGGFGDIKSFPNLEDYEKARPEVAERNRYY